MRTTTPEDFARFLAWLHPDPTQAGDEYERLRRRIARFFAYRGCPDADTLADEVVDRVVARMEGLQARYSGECASYLYGVARNVYLEFLRGQSAETRFREAVRARPPEDGSAEADRARREREQDCLDRCLGALTDEDRALVTAYYQSDASGRPARRRALADQAGLTAANLRQRSHRLRERLRACLARCIERVSDVTGTAGGPFKQQGDAAPGGRAREDRS